MFEKLRIKEALKICMEVSSLANKFVQDNKIWEKDIDKQSLMNKLFILANIIRFISLM
jgi:methionyl-tRNA synthetase